MTAAPRSDVLPSDVPPSASEVLASVYTERGGKDRFSPSDRAIAIAYVRALFSLANDRGTAAAVASLAELLPPKVEGPVEPPADLTLLTDKQLHQLHCLVAITKGEAPPAPSMRRKRSPRLRDAALLAELCDRIQVEHDVRVGQWQDRKVKGSPDSGEPYPEVPAGDLAELRNSVARLLPSCGSTFERVLGLPITAAHFAPGLSWTPPAADLAADDAPADVPPSPALPDNVTRLRRPNVGEHPIFRP
jgi:hypothetical protein